MVISASSCARSTGCCGKPASKAPMDDARKAANAAASHEMVHAEGPFGVLDAQGFTVLDRGAVVQFTGPARLVLNGGSR